MHGISHLLYPPNCFLCKTYIHPDFPNSVLCRLCFQSITLNKPTFCPKCSRHMGEHPTRVLCRECHFFRPHFDFAWGCCQYNNTIKKLIYSFKYGQKTLLRKPLVEAMTAFVNAFHLDIDQFDSFLPIPLYSARQRERGFNQAEILAKDLGQYFSKPLLKHSLKRIRSTKSQAILSKKERWTNIYSAFRIKNSNTIKDQNILLIDDLLTTGATASEAARTLKDAGARRVSVLALAIAHPDK